MEEEIKSEKIEKGQEDSMKIVLEAFDSSFSTGSFGLGYNGMSMSAVDELEIEGKYYQYIYNIILIYIML